MNKNLRVRINIQIFIVMIVLALTKQIEIYAWLMLFALLHELAHMIAGLCLKLKPKALSIEPFGIGIEFEDFENTEKNKIIIATAGPALNIILAILFSFINIKHQNLIININILLAICNLLPIYPLDGGRILKSVIRIKHEKQTAEDIVNKISNFLMITMTFSASILILIYHNIGLFLIIIYLWIIIMRENKRYLLKKRINNLIQKKE